MTTKEAIEIWKKKKIKSCVMDFSCGGDSMNDYDFEFFNDKDKAVKCEDLFNFFEDAVFKNVSFYVDSDGHYIGEAGTVNIRLNEDGEDFEYGKSSESEWSESYSGVSSVKLEKPIVEFIKEKVHSIVGGTDGSSINFKGDCILTDQEEEYIQQIEVEFRDHAYSYDFPDSEGDMSDWFNFSTRIDGEDNEQVMVDEEGRILLEIQKSYTVFKGDSI